MSEELPEAAQVSGNVPVKALLASPMYCKAGKASGAPQLPGKAPTIDLCLRSKQTGKLAVHRAMCRHNTW